MKKFPTKNNLNLNELKNKIKIKNKEYIKNPSWVYFDGTILRLSFWGTVYIKKMIPMKNRLIVLYLRYSSFLRTNIWLKAIRHADYAKRSV